MSEEILKYIVEDKLVKHTCQLLKKGGKHGYIPHGSGVLITIEKSYYLFSTSHNFDGLETEENSLFIYTAQGIIKIIGEIVRSNLAIIDKYDLAYVKLDVRMKSYLLSKYKFLDLREILKKHEISAKVNYLTFGYPVSNKKEVDEFLVTSGSSYLIKPSKEKVYKHYDFNSELYMLFDWKGKSKDRNGLVIVTDEPHGISGCGLWVVGNIEHKKHLFCFLAGIMTEYKKGKYYVVVANKLENMIRHIIRK